MLRPQASVRPRTAAAGARRGVEPVAQRRRLCRRSRSGASRRRSSGCRPTLFVPSAAHADRAELPAVALVGDGRGTDHHGRALSRRGAHAHRRSTASPRRTRISLEPKAEADFRAAALRRASARFGDRRGLVAARAVAAAAQAHGLDQGGAQAARRRQRRDPVQPRHPADRARSRAAGHRRVRQGPAAVCWNRQFGEILDLPPSSSASASRSTRSCASTPSAARSAATRSTSSCASRLERYVAGSEPFLERFAERDLVIEVRANRMPDGGIVTTFTDITPSVEAAEALERANETLERRVRERTEELTRLNAALGRAKGEADEANISKTKFPRRRQPRHPAAAQRRAALRHQPDRAAGGGEDRAAGRQYRRLARRGRGDPRRAARHLAARHRRDEAGDSPTSASTSCCASSKLEFAPLAREQGPRARIRALLAGGALRSPPAAPAAAEPGLQRDQIHAGGPRAGRLPAPRRPAAHRRLRHRPRHSASKQRDIFMEFHRLDQGAKVARGLGLGLSIVERIARVLDYNVERRIRRSAAARISRSTCRVSNAAPVEAGGARRPRASIRAQLAGITVLCIDNEPYDPRRHGDAARRLGLRGAQGAGSRRPRWRRSRKPQIRRTACWSTIISTTATASTPSSSCAGASAPICRPS